MSDKRMTIEEIVGEVKDGMTVGIGGWGPRRKPMALVRGLLRTGVKDLTIVAYGGADLGLLCANGQVKRAVYGFVSLDSIPLEPHFRAARESGAIEATELDEGMLQWGLYAASLRLPFLPTRAGLGSDVMRVNPQLKTVTSPYADCEELVAMPALKLDIAFVHQNRADARGNAQYLGPDVYFDDIFCSAADKAYVSCEKIIETDDFLTLGPPQSLRIHRSVVTGVVETPNGAHFSSCDPDYSRDESFQKEYATAAADPAEWAAFKTKYYDVDEAGYQRLVTERAA